MFVHVFETPDALLPDNALKARDTSKKVICLRLLQAMSSCYAIFT